METETETETKMSKDRDVYGEVIQPETSEVQIPYYNIEENKVIWRSDKSASIHEVIHNDEGSPVRTGRVDMILYPYAFFSPDKEASENYSESGTYEYTVNQELKMICFSDGTNQKHIYDIANNINISDLNLRNINLNEDQSKVLNQLLDDNKTVGDLLRDNYGFDKNGIIFGSGRHSQGTPDRVVSLFLSQNFAEFGFDGYAANFIKKDKNDSAFHAELMLFNPNGLVSTNAEFKQKSPELPRTLKRTRNNENDDENDENQDYQLTFPLPIFSNDEDENDDPNARLYTGGNLKRYYISYNNAY